MLLVHVFVCLAIVDFCPVPLDGREWLRLVIVALPGFHINFLSQTIFLHERAGNPLSSGYTTTRCRIFASTYQAVSLR